eukprot:TRINITY_DN5923_c1_g1_i2.p1 TRINITY_DN5923_c1_g1~~TRINITY_DN5923_c1_g1_i2.p1  ORF type:complete len:856 (-),score=285.68 TRINITY_DN5923_c1_g1_i2:238-2505(-)
MGVTRSPVFTTFMQVMSRLVLVHMFTLRSPAAQAHYSLFLMVGSWALVEIPRYTFYSFAQVMAGHEIPAPLFWLRYTLFVILYPTGISGEWLQMAVVAPGFAAGKVSGPLVWGLSKPLFTSATAYKITTFLMFMYFVGGPFMINNMWGMRKRAYRNRNRAKNPPPQVGVTWPVTNAKTGERSSLKTNQAIWEAALTPAGLNGELAKQRGWRGAYKKWVNRSVGIACASPEAALAQSKAGLAKAMELFQYVESAGDKPVSLASAFASALKGKSVQFDTVSFKGGKPASKFTCSVPYAGKSGEPYHKFAGKAKKLEGDALKKQLDQWVKYGTIEKDAADAIRACIDNPDLVDLRDKTFVILGATSAMGPIDVLLQHGATVVAIDLDRPGIWQRLLTKVRNSPGSIIFPVKKGKGPEVNKSMPSEGAAESEWSKWINDVAAPVAGSNLLAKAPHIARWLTSLIENNDIPKDDSVSIGNYTYLDGELHVRLSVSCNGIIAALCDANPGTKVCFLCTPTDCHVIPKDAWEDAGKNYRNAPLWQRLCAMIGLGLKPNQMKPVKQDGKGKPELYLVDGIVHQQGPNYALAKRMQHWMAVVQRDAGHGVSSNVAPSTATISVVHNVLFAWAYGGMHFFKPMEVMFQETSNALMGALMMYDISRDCKGAANPKVKLDNPMELFSKQGMHGGLWRVGYALNTTGNTTVLAHLISSNLSTIIAVVAIGAAVLGWCYNGGCAQTEAALAGFDPLKQLLSLPFFARIL